MAGTRGRPGLPTPPQGEAIAAYGTYEAAQRAVDHLSDEHFPVENITVVGEGLQLVERVTGRLTYARAAGAGAASGAWFGVFIGVLLTLFGGQGGALLLAAVLLGVAFGLLFGVIGYALTGGRRDFTSFSQMVARRYVVLCRGPESGRAYWLLQRLTDNPPLPESAATDATPARPHDPASTAADETGRRPEDPGRPSEDDLLPPPDGRSDGTRVGHRPA